MGVHRLFQQVVTDYESLEPGSSDTWNPLHDDVELDHRVELFRHLAWGVREAGVDPTETTVLDLGCGNGRSTRMYLDLGWTPKRVSGLDLRAGALEHARTRHPTIRYAQYDGESVPPSFRGADWASLCTVMSSVRAPEARAHLAACARDAVKAGGHLFFWDLLVANPFAGGDPLRPAELFPGWSVVWERRCTIGGFRDREGQDASEDPTHQAVLLRR